LAVIPKVDPQQRLADAELGRLGLGDAALAELVALDQEVTHLRPLMLPRFAIAR
jgi:hypothetical protein